MADMRTYVAELPGTLASGVVNVSAFSHMDAHAAGIVVDEEVRRLAAKERLGPAETVREYRRLQQAVFDQNSGLKEAYSQPAPRDPAPRVTTTTPTGYGSGPSDAQLLSAFAATVAESTGRPNDGALRMQIMASPSWQRFLERNRQGMEFTENMHGRRGGTVRRHAITSVAEGRKPIPASMDVLEWELTSGFEGYSDAVSWAPIDVVVARHDHDEYVMKVRAQEVADYQRGHRGR